MLWIMATVFPVLSIWPWSALDDGDGILANGFTVRGIAGTAARFVDPRGLVCAAGVCPLVVGDQVFFYDDDHITASWSRLVAPALEQLTGPLVRPAPAG